MENLKSHHVRHNWFESVEERRNAASQKSHRVGSHEGAVRGAHAAEAFDDEPELIDVRFSREKRRTSGNLHNHAACVAT